MASVDAPTVHSPSASDYSEEQSADEEAPVDPFETHPLGDLFRKLLDIEQGQGRPIHIVQLGDSEIASDAVTMTTRKLAADRFGDGGPGFVLAMKPWPSYSRSGVLHEMPEQFEVVSFPRAQASDGRYGPGGVGFDGSEAGGTSLFLRSELRGKPCEVGFIYLQQIGGGQFRLSADGKTYAHGLSHGPKGTAKHTHHFEQCPKRLKFHWGGNGQFRAFGWQIHGQSPGVSWTSLGVNGARMTALRNYRGTDLVDSLAVLSPDILIMSFGLNIAAYPRGPNRKYSSQIEEVISNLRSGLPDVPCLVLGPYPVATKLGGRWEASPTVPRVGDAQREVAEKYGCVFVDRYARLGGDAAVEEWRTSNPKMLSADNVHLTRLGSERMGQFLFRLVTGEYDRLKGSASAL